MIRFLGFLFSAGSIAAIAGVAIVGAVLWIYDRDLPDYDELKTYQPATLSRVYSGEGEVIAEFAAERRIFTPIDEIPPLVKNAFISAEDKNFYVHSGVDGLGIVKAMLDNLRRIQTGERLRGASTITQQVIKNFLLSSESPVERKIKEFILSSRIESALGKEQILELYLNDIFLGQNAYGVTAAARRYFGKTPEELKPEEAAYLAALPKAPSSYHPVRQREGAVQRRNYVLEEMAQNGYLTRSEAEAAKATPLETVIGGEIESHLPPIPNYTYFTDEIRRQLSARLGREELFGGGLTVRATLDPELQAMAARALRAKLESWDREKDGWRGPLATLDEVSAADEADWRAKLAATPAPSDIEGWRKAVVLEVGEKSARIGIDGVDEDSDGHYIPFDDVKDWARPRLTGGGRGAAPKRPSDVFAVGDVILVKAIRKDDGALQRWSLRQIPEIQGAFMAMDPHTGRVLALQGGFSYEASVFDRATQAERQPGSAFKPFVYAAALDNGYSPATIVLDAPVVVRLAGGDWKPKNYSNKFYGPSPLRLGLEMSRNLMTVRLAQDVGMDIVADYAERFGVYDQMPAHLSYALGAGETTLWRMVAAYGMFANGGRRVEPTLVDRVQNRRGETIYRHDSRICDACAAPDPGADGIEPWPKPTAKRIMDRITAYQLVSMMEGVASRGTAARLSALGVPVAGKTGTTNEAKDAWFVGFTPDLVAGCFIGYDDPRPMGRGGTGGGMCAPVFQAFMTEALKIRPAGRFETPEGVEFAYVDRYTGERVPEGAGGSVIREVFREGRTPAMYETAPIVGDLSSSFFGGGDLPMTLGGNAAEIGDGESDAAGDAEYGAGAGAGGGGGPRPPRNLDRDLESGGVY
ncbi:penicillin-binding protein 1A [Pikeienuella sp. HZG-20]|uniref:penicillin-binding protein 1A n=1 Tax=Paludibacillus litoralis TaxID=3133267 RepID=UPI0030EEA319